MKKLPTFNRPETVPGTAMWCERAYPPIAGLHKHPCPFDYWDGKAWRPGMPDNNGKVQVKATGMGLIYLGSVKIAPTLAWRKASILIKPEVAK